jgi:glycerophosphoryl diester phosphodiesterase
LRAYRRAIEMGADGVECDVRLTSDGVLVCIHDRTVDRTSNGTGVVSTMTLADLHRLDFGSWVPGGEPAEILTLEQLVAALQAAGRPMELAIETKHPTRFGSRVERAVVAMIERLGLGEVGSSVTARVMSFSPPAVAAARRWAPGIEAVQLMQRIPANRRDGGLWKAATCAGPSLAAVKAMPQYVARAHERGHEVHVWTVDEAADLAYVAELGVDVVITNRPDVALAQFGR